MKLSVCDANAFESQQLREEASGQEKEDVIVLRAWDDSGEEALLVLAFLTATEAELEKLFVPPSTRGKGTASRALALVEQYCRERSITTLKLWANPLDDATDQDWLIGWYKRRGYVDSGDGFAELMKVL